MNNKKNQTTTTKKDNNNKVDLSDAFPDSTGNVDTKEILSFINSESEKTGKAVSLDSIVNHFDTTENTATVANRKKIRHKLQAIRKTIKGYDGSNKGLQILTMGSDRKNNPFDKDMAFIFSSGRNVSYMIIEPEKIK